jgi:hypothetical protein
MSNVISVDFPGTQGPRSVEIEWRIRAYDKASLNLLEVTHTDKTEAITTSRRLYSQGYDITVHQHLIEKVADWTYDKDWNEGDT